MSNTNNTFNNNVRWQFIGNSTEKLNTSTEYNNEYKTHENVRRKPILPVSNGHFKESSSFPIQEETTHKHDFTRHPLTKIQLREPEVYEKPKHKMDVLTSYNNEFNFKEGKKVQPIKPVGQINPLIDRMPIQNETTHKNDYIQHEVGERVQSRQPEIYKKPEKEMESLTSYNNEFTFRPTTRVSPIKPVSIRPEHAKFENSPTYRDDYREWNVKKTYFNNVPTQAFQHLDLELPFASNTTYVDDYISHKNKTARSIIKPIQTNWQSTEKLDTNTSYKTNFVQYEIPEKYQHPKYEYQPSGEPLDSLTTTKNDFAPKELDKTILDRKKFKPDSINYVSKEAFQNDTTHKNDFKQWVITELPSRKKQNEWTQPEGEINLTTSYNFEFTTKSTPRIQPIRAPSKKKIEAKFDTETTYSNDFSGWKLNSSLINS